MVPLIKYIGMIVSFLYPDMSHGDYGVGLYFNQHPAKAAHFSAVSLPIFLFYILSSIFKILLRTEIYMYYVEVHPI